MQPHILFPILIFAFGMGAFLTTFVGDVNSEDGTILTDSKNDIFFTKEEALKKESLNSESVDSENRTKWLYQFQESKVANYHYPATEVSIHLPLEKPDHRKRYKLTTEYLEPYQNFCVNQVLNKLTNIRYKLIETGDKIKFKIESTDNRNIDAIVKEFKYYDIQYNRF